MPSSPTETTKAKQDLDSTNVRPHLRALTSLRFLAALLVVGFHVGHDLWSQVPWWIANFFSNGYEAVLVEDSLPAAARGVELISASNLICIYLHFIFIG
jgi:peptidoglycan/LPS O-acetylase OafA/YrhL